MVKGGAGEREFSRSSNSLTRQLPVSAPSATPLALASVRSITSRPATNPSLSRPVSGSKSRPVARRIPPRWVMVASNGLPPLASVAVRLRYCAGTNFRRSFSRSTRSLTATLWTLPALSLGAIFFQSRGEMV